MSTADSGLILERHSLAKQLVADAVRDLDGYRSLMEDLLQQAESKEVTEFEEHAGTLDEEKRDSFLQWNCPFHWQQVFIPQFRMSFAAWALAIAEFHLDWVCETVRLTTGTSETPEETRGRSKVRRAKRFLEGVGGFSKSSDQVWDALSDAYRLRNAIAHAGGYVHDDRLKARLTQPLRRFSGIRLVNGALEIEEVFCREICDTVAASLEFLLREEDALIGSLL